MNLESICKAVCVLTTEVGAFILAERKTFSQEAVEYKSPHDLVSYVDKTAEKMLVAGLKPLLPEAGFITEEDSSREVASMYNWIIDPLDGTTNFIHGLPCFCISIALVKNNVPILGVVHELNLNECFYAWEGSDAYMNGNKIKVSLTPSLDKSLLATGFPSLNYSKLEEFMEVFVHCMRHTRGLRRLGSAAADLAYVACGRLDGFFEYGLSSWDVAGGAFIVQQAGGKVTDFSGGGNFLFGAEINASNKLIHESFNDVLKTFFINKI